MRSDHQKTNGSTDNHAITAGQAAHELILRRAELELGSARYGECAETLGVLFDFVPDSRAGWLLRKRLAHVRGETEWMELCSSMLDGV